MNKMKLNLSKAVLLAIAPMVLAFNTSWAGLNLQLLNGYRQERIDFLIENLDENEFRNAGYTSEQTSVKQFRTYQLGLYATWMDKCSHLYAQISGQYGIAFDGKVVSCPLNWNLDGHTTDFDVRIGYIFNVCCCFDVIPILGYNYSTIHYKIRRQHFSHTSPDYYTNQNGDKTNITFSTPYVGFDVLFNHCFCQRYRFDFDFGYYFSYGWDHISKRVPEFVITNNPRTSRYGWDSKGHNIIAHEFKFETRYTFRNCWEVGLKFLYNVAYNTHRNDLTLQHNHEIVESGQFRHSQYHTLTESYFHSYEIDLGIAYNF